MKVCVFGAQRKATLQLDTNPHQNIDARIAQVMLHWWFMAYWELVSSFWNLEINVETLHALQTCKMDPLEKAASILMLLFYHIWMIWMHNYGFNPLCVCLLKAEQIAGLAFKCHMTCLQPLVFFLFVFLKHMTAPCTASTLSYLVQSHAQQWFVSNGQVLISLKKEHPAELLAEGCFQTYAT